MGEQAPERIWATSNFHRWSIDSGKLLADHGCREGTEYVRADLLAEAVKALESIAANTCCDSCREAALVARAALAKIKAPTP